ncbi:hypothetical protein C2869_08895 [Saccharobesus litoralis]|uniref:Alginate export domain-containing protein n=1 Tax=Saccharobesus litoralis TaxID=2172099 RepID=A0A2S0VQQ1_9ALTE|nr:hypothetical protein [Saccharobesus litoralis]AWB66538.1 hypothetical protein C2869_08895 [Saccharobesus litoralis]
MNFKKSALAILPAIFLSHISFADELSGHIGIETRLYTQDPIYTEQADQQISLHAETEFYFEVGENGNGITFTPYIRLNSEDAASNQFDLREFMYLHVGDDWELKVGLGKVFWGVTETLHLVDIINQTDNLASFDGEEKLGQAMIHYSQINDWGVIDAFILPGFRERSFAGNEGRLRPQLKIIEDASYESSDGQSHIDYALRWSHSIDDWDLGLSWFNGTSREADFKPVASATGVELQPFYGQINQLGVDVQYIYQDWLWKLEAITRQSDTMQDINAAVGGFEYSQVGILDTAIDLGWVVEYAFDNRDSNVAPRQNDISFATRWALNDAESTEFLVGFSQDLEHSGSRSAFVEGSTRVGDSLVVTVDAWFFSADTDQDLSYAVRNDDFVQVDFSYYF